MLGPTTAYEGGVQYMHNGIHAVAKFRPCPARATSHPCLFALQGGSGLWRGARFTLARGAGRSVRTWLRPLAVHLSIGTANFRTAPRKRGGSFICSVPDLSPTD